MHIYTKNLEEEMIIIEAIINENELTRAKDYLLGKTKLAMDKTSYMADFVGEKVLLENSEETIEEELDKYKKVTFKEVKDLAKEIFKKEEIRSLVCHNR